MEISDFRSIADLVREHALATPSGRALVDDDDALTYAELDRLMDRVASALQRDQINPGESIVLAGRNSVWLAAVFLGALRAGVVVVPLATGVTAQSFESMLRDSEARLLFVDESAIPCVPANARTRCISLATELCGLPLAVWLSDEETTPSRVEIKPDWPFNIIYSSGTTGAPKGIVQPHRMRWLHVCRGARYGYGAESITLVSTPLYSNTTLVVFFPTIAFGGTVFLMKKFDARQYLQLAQQWRVTHSMLVPVQYQRILANTDFDEYDLTSFQVKFCTSAPFSAALKADVLRRWPGSLVEFYGMTEGGGTCILEAHLHPDKLHTVGKPSDGHDIRLIDEEGQCALPGVPGEVVGHSPATMIGYHGQPALTGAAEWFDETGKRFIRTGDIGRFDDDGFLILLDRKKDLIISGGFNIYPCDLEAILLKHPSVAEVAVVGVASERWGETPVAFVVLSQNGATENGLSAPQLAMAADLLSWANAQLGKTQRLADLRLLAELPRSPIGKVLKRELLDRYPMLFALG